MSTSADKSLTGGDKPEPYNAVYDSLACNFCRAQLTKQQQHQRNRFCSHACYCDWMRAQPMEPRFWAQVHKTSTCWNWTGPRTGSGSVRHGQFMWRAKYRSPQKAHRVAWELANGPIPADKQINHRCDNPICVRLDHLYLGTQLQNMQDAAGKSRLSVPRTRSLSLFNRLTIYHTKAYRGVCVNLAREYGVSKACISIVRSGRFLGSGVWGGTKALFLDAVTEDK